MARLRKYIELYRYNVPIEFSQNRSKEGEDGTSRPDFQLEFTLNAAKYDVVRGEQSLNTGPNQEEQLYYAVQEIDKVQLNMFAKLNDKIYIVDEVTGGDPTDPRSWDLLRLTWGNGVESGYRGVNV